MKCKHLHTTEAFWGKGDGDWNATTCFLCVWPRERLEGAPVWVGKKIGGGYPIDPKAECRICPAFEKDRASTGEET